MVDNNEYTSYLNIEDVGPQDNGDYCVRLQLQPKHLSRAGLIHGGMVFTLLDTAMGRAVLHSLKSGYHSPTIEMKINYFRPAASGMLETLGRVVNSSRQLSYAEGEVRNQEGKLIARATGTFFVKESVLIKPLPSNVNS